MYQQFMKVIISKKITLGDDQVILTKKCSIISQGRKIPIKWKDHGSITIPCTINDKTFKKVLVYTGANVSLMPLSIYQKLGIGKIKDTRMNLKFVE